MSTLADELVKVDELEHVPRESKHAGHDPSDASALLVETLAMCQCSMCSDGRLRWYDKEYGFFVHMGDDGDETIDCDATNMLEAANKIGVPIYTGAELEFVEVN